MAPALQTDRFRNRSDSAVPDRANIVRIGRYAAGQIRFFASELRQPRRCNQRVRGWIDVERKERASEWGGG
jgi:hypothetical protein